ncbi:uncharacterized protein LOC105235550 isoform X1 [Ailuropoda melanoleuca]|uniref:uncharacterized protein LOC105235550 isoform X1 n=1 Tax=Ailuropoda melanoleuca TaxID=9646 RepID=UPI0009482A12|nr:uncharacterized protein LOC105235550 isoform X1 [Ailuropoda melanoleuca]
MRGEQHQAVDIEQSAVELLPRNPYCSNEGTHCGCRLPTVTLQPPWVTAKPWSLWKTFLMESRITSPATLVLPHLLPHQPHLDLLPLCSTKAPLPSTKAPLPTCLHPPWRQLKQQHWSMKLSSKIKNDSFEPLALLQPDQHLHPGEGVSRCLLLPAKRLQSIWLHESLPFLPQSFAVFPYGNDSVLGPPIFK